MTQQPQHPQDEKDVSGGGSQDDRQKAPPAPPAEPDPEAGIDREVGDLEDPNADEDGALPGRVGGGLAGG